MLFLPLSYWDFWFWHTHPACTVCGKFGMIAECRKIDPGFSDNRQNIFFICELYPSVIDCHITHLLPLLPFNMDRTKRTGTLTSPALNAFIIVNYIRLFDPSADGICRTVPCTFGTSFAAFRADDKSSQGIAVMRSALLVNHMLHILIAEQF